MTLRLMASMSRRKAFAGTAATAALLAAPAIVRAQAKALKIGVLLPRSGYMAPTGQGSHRGAMIAPKVLADYGHHVEFVHIDTESNVDAARIAAERVINEGAHCIVGNVDSGGTMAIAQVCEQHQVPLVVNVGAAPQITEQGFKYVARNFPHAGMLMGGGLRLIKNLLDVTKLEARAWVFLYANDTFGQAQRGALDALFPRAGLPFLVTDHIAFDPRAQDLSLEVTKIRASTRTRDGSHPRQRQSADPDMVRQRFLPKAIISPGSSGMFEEEYYQDLSPLADYTIFHFALGQPQIADGTREERVQASQLPFPSRMLLCRLHLRGLGRSRCVQAIKVDEWARAHESDPPNRYRRPHHHRPADQVRRRGRMSVSRRPRCRAAT